MVGAPITVVCIPGSNLTQMQNQEMGKCLSSILSIMNFSILSTCCQMHKLIILKCYIFWDPSCITCNFYLLIFKVLLWCLLFEVTNKNFSVVKSFIFLPFQENFSSVSEKMMIWNMCRGQRMCMFHIYIYERECSICGFVSICTFLHCNYWVICLNWALCFCIPTAISYTWSSPCRVVWWSCSPEDVVKSLLFPSINCSHSIITLYSCRSIFLCI